MATQHSQRTYHDEQQAKVKEWIAGHGLDEKGRNYWTGLARDVTEEAVKHGRANQLGTSKWGELDDLLNAALDVVDETMMAVNGGYIADGAEIKGWRHHRNVATVALQTDAPEILKDNIESAAALYLKLPVRSEKMDYTLVELLIACELFAYTREMRWALKQRSLWGWVKGRVYSACFWFALVVAANWLFDADWGTVVFWIYIAETALTVAALFVPNKAAKLLKEMNGVYCELSPSGPYSARHIDQRARTAADRGVVWPAPLFAVLDDIISRGGRF